MKLLWLDWENVDRLCRILARKIKRAGFSPDVVVGISRGGFPVARILCDELGIRRLASLQIEYYSAPNQTRKKPVLLYPLNADVRGKRVLIVDDVADRGESLELAKKHVKEKGAKEIRLATVHYKPWSKVVPDFYVRTVKSWIVYPWERKETQSQLKEMRSNLL
jgi:hypoxanthine phosphoribosyltransferase